MNHSERTHRATGAGRVWRGPILVLLATLAGQDAPGMPRVEWRVSPAPDFSHAYLPAIGPAPLRFEVEPAMPDPIAPLSVPEIQVPEAGADDEQPPALSNEQPDNPNAPGVEAVSPEMPSDKVPAGILLDDIRPAVRPEDLIPYFQIPGSNHQRGDLTLVVPVPHSAPTAPSLPSSSATYIQTQK